MFSIFKLRFSWAAITKIYQSIDTLAYQTSDFLRADSLLTFVTDLQFITAVVTMVRDMPQDLTLALVQWEETTAIYYILILDATSY